MTSLAVGSSVVLYDGSPFKPTPNALWDLIDEVGITILGTGAKWLSALEDREIQPGLCRVFFLRVYSLCNRPVVHALNLVLSEFVLTAPTPMQDVMSIWIGSFCMLSPVSKHSLLGGTHLLDISKLIILT